MSVELDFDGIEKALRDRGMFGDLPWMILQHARQLKAERDKLQERIDAVHALLADRDAHLADLTEARDLLEEARSTTIMEQIADRLWERVDYFWERTK